MSQIEWCDSHSVGIPSIDDQHRQLVALTNRLFVAIMREEGGMELGGVLTELAQYAEYHFEYEEQVLEEYGFPETELTLHRDEHRYLTDQVYKLIDQHNEAPDTMDLEVYSFLRDWMTEHMSGTDSEYSGFLVSKGAK